MAVAERRAGDGAEVILSWAPAGSVRCTTLTAASCAVRRGGPGVGHARLTLTETRVVHYDLQPNESIVYVQDRVRQGGAWGHLTDQLILTNKNLVLVKKGFFGGGKSVHVFPLSQIKVFDGAAQVRVGWLQSCPTLEVYFLNGQEVFLLERKEAAADLAQMIDDVIAGVGGHPIDSRDEGPIANAIRSQVEMADALRSQVDLIKATFGIRSKTQSTTGAPRVAREAGAPRVARECYACGAPLSGKQGQVATCSYCDTPIQL